MSKWKDSDGNEIDLYRLINKEPEWAVNIIEKLQSENKAFKEENKTYEDIAFDLTRRLHVAGKEIEALKKAQTIKEKSK